MSKNKGKTKTNKLKKDFNRELYGIIIIACGILFMISLFSFKMGIIGSIIRGTTFSLMGFGGYFFPIIIICIGLIFILDKFNKIEINTILLSTLIFINFLIFLDGRNASIGSFINRMEISRALSNLNKGGGLIGSFLGFFFYKLFDKVGGYLVLFFVTLISTIMIFNIKIKDIMKKISSISNINLKEKEEKPIKKDLLHNKIKSKFNKKKDIKILDYNDSVNSSKKIQGSKIASNEITDTIKKSQSKESKNMIYHKPSFSLLSDPKNKKDIGNKKEILNNAKLIEKTMDNFGIEATVTQINKGPTITCYELSPSPGIKLNRIVSLSDNISLSLASSDIRIEAPIPGKSAVGIEVPNKIKESVLLKEILLTDEYKNIDSPIPLSLGKDVSGKPIISSIDKMPHLLIAGATGSGKSVCINSIIMNIIYKASLKDVKLLLIDPKVVELSGYNGIPHLLIPVVTDTKKAAFALNWIVEEMERRYQLFAQNNVRDINSYNDKIKSNKTEDLHTIVVIIDELADLMMVAAQEIEDYICRIAQMARAAGIYLIVATQRPSVDVITGTIKANIPSRISFAVSSQVDSRTILDMSGAEKLLGRGDMLFYPSFYSKPLRIQGAFISDSEIEKVVDFLKDNNYSEYDEEIIENIENNADVNLRDGDELLPNAIELVVDEGQASISMLQRKLKIGYARAARIIDEMEEREIVGGFEGSKPRKVLISKENLSNSNIQ